jgi:hypothetical protein
MLALPRRVSGNTVAYRVHMRIHGRTRRPWKDDAYDRVGSVGGRVTAGRRRDSRTDSVEESE